MGKVQLTAKQNQQLPCISITTGPAQGMDSELTCSSSFSIQKMKTTMQPENNLISDAAPLANQPYSPRKMKRVVGRM